MVTTRHKPDLLVALTGAGVPYPAGVAALINRVPGKSSAT
jgi:hypothetical protein